MYNQFKDKTMAVYKNLNYRIRYYLYYIDVYTYGSLVHELLYKEENKSRRLFG